MPENTVLYVAIPNISETLGRANQILQENLAKNPELKDWYEKEGRHSKGRQGLNKAIDLAREFGGYLGDEIALSVEAGANNGEPEEPVVLADVKDGGAFRSFLENKMSELGEDRNHLRIVDDPVTAVAGAGKDEQGGFYVWITNDLVVAS